ncbi:hypothetical protein [Candidatus Poriferisocius sp.]|uniref:hypothetical protein n=1 Tax=Candidatus Poriferisocius sp. TaxID=3101276 RepID=UPI003B02847C
MGALSDLYPTVRAHVSGVSDPLMATYLKRAAKQFCQDTKVWDVNVGKVDLQPPANPMLRFRIEVPSRTVGVTDFVLPAGSYLNSISRVRYAIDPNMEPEDLPNEEWSYDIPTRDLVLEPRTISQAMTLHVDAVLENLSTASAVPDWMSELWGEGIADYCIFELLSLANKEWTDPALAGIFRGKYQARVSEATIAKARKGSRQPLETEPIAFV